MYDKTKVIIGLGMFLAVATLPFWIGFGDTEPMPEPVIREGLEACVEPKEFMRANHMQLLDEWRDSAVRKSERVYVSSSGKEFEKSLTETCLDCHSNKEEFCDRCHKSVAVEPYCWSCHLVPVSETETAQSPDQSKQAARELSQGDWTPGAALLESALTLNPAGGPNGPQDARGARELTGPAAVSGE